MEHAQIKLETSVGVDFFSPFVYRFGDGIERMAKLGWLERNRGQHRKGELSLVKVDHFPSAVLWNPKFAEESTQRFLLRIRNAEAHWAAWQAVGKLSRKGSG